MKQTYLVAKYKHPQSNWPGYFWKQKNNLGISYDLKYRPEDANQFDNNDEGKKKAISLIVEVCKAKKLEMHHCSLSEITMEEVEINVTFKEFFDATSTG